MVLPIIPNSHTYPTQVLTVLTRAGLRTGSAVLSPNHL
jgi:hypothetical protein